MRDLSLATNQNLCLPSLFKVAFNHRAAGLELNLLTPNRAGFQGFQIQSQAMNSTTNSTRQAIIERICLNVTDLRVLAVLNCTNTKSISNQPITTWTDTAPTVIVNRRPSSTPVVASPTANVKTQDWNWGNVLTRSNYSIMIVLIVTFVAALCAIFISFACKRRRSKDNVKELVERASRNRPSWSLRTIDFSLSGHILTTSMHPLLITLP